MNVSPPPPALRDVVPPGYCLRLPGPAAVPERVRAALAQPVLNHRGLEFTPAIYSPTCTISNAPCTISGRRRRPAPGSLPPRVLAEQCKPTAARGAMFQRTEEPC